jgi:Domain of unknown function (DUF4331)
LKKLASVGGVAGLAVATLLAATGRAADHADSPTLASNRMADITDVYAWMTGSNLNLVMDVSPQDDGTRAFGPSVLYVFHLTSKSGIGVGMLGGGTETRVICRFVSNLSVECWVTDAAGRVTKDYVTGNPSGIAGVTSILGKVKVFAGRRADPFFFNLAGFNDAMSSLAPLASKGADAARCPAGITASEAVSIRDKLVIGSDAFTAAKVMAIVLQVDRSLVNAGNNTAVAVWASTHAAGS